MLKCRLLAGQRAGYGRLDAWQLYPTDECPGKLPHFDRALEVDVRQRVVAAPVWSAV
jgi:hypothetical protein